MFVCCLLLILQDHVREIYTTNVCHVGINSGEESCLFLYEPGSALPAVNSTFTATATAWFMEHLTTIVCRPQCVCIMFARFIGGCLCFIHIYDVIEFSVQTSEALFFIVTAKCRIVTALPFIQFTHSAVSLNLRSRVESTSSTARPMPGTSKLRPFKHKSVWYWPLSSDSCSNEITKILCLLNSFYRNLSNSIWSNMPIHTIHVAKKAYWKSHFNFYWPLTGTRNRKYITKPTSDSSRLGEETEKKDQSQTHKSLINTRLSQSLVRFLLWFIFVT